MKLTPIDSSALGDVPPEISAYFNGAELFDSSCSKLARTVLISSASGDFFLKISPEGMLASEADTTDVFHSFGCAAEVVAYHGGFGGRDFFLTRRLIGEDGGSQRILAEPERFIHVFARELRRLHDTDASTLGDVRTAKLRHGMNGDTMAEAALKTYDSGVEVDYWLFSYITPHASTSPVPPFSDEAVRGFADELRRGAGLLRTDELIHGDACVVNVIMNGFDFAGFVDLGDGGMGDRHHDIFWALWSLQYNLKTRNYADMFLDEYGRDAVDETRLRLAGIANALCWTK